MTISENVARGKAVAELLELGEALCSDGGWDIASFWRAVSVGAAERAGIVNEVDYLQRKPERPKTKLNDDDTLTWERSVYSGYRLGDIPDDWWRWFLSRDWCDNWPDLVEYANHCVEDES
jgi:hypothetical protein